MTLPVKKIYTRAVKKKVADLNACGCHCYLLAAAIIWFECEHFWAILTAWSDFWATPESSQNLASPFGQVLRREMIKNFFCLSHEEISLILAGKSNYNVHVAKREVLKNVLLKGHAKPHIKYYMRHISCYPSHQIKKITYNATDANVHLHGICTYLRRKKKYFHWQFAAIFAWSNLMHNTDLWKALQPLQIALYTTSLAAEVINYFNRIVKPI